MIELGEQRKSRKRSMSPPEGPMDGQLQNGGLPLALTNGASTAATIATTTTTTSANGRSTSITTAYAPPEAGLINKKLPKELLLKIFSFLDIVSLCRCAQVSKEWNVLAMDGSNWQNIDLFSFQRDVTYDVVSYIAQRCGGFLRRISLRGCQNVPDQALSVFAQHCHNIEQVMLTNCHKLSDESVVSLSMACRFVYSLHVDSCVELTDRSLRFFNRLRVIDISWCRKITGQGIGMIAGDQLLRFTAKGCTGLDNEAIIKLAARSPKLQLLNLQCCSFLTDSAVIAVSQNCPDLRHLCVSGCTLLTDASPQALATGCLRLHTFEMANCQRCGDAGLAPLLKACHDLRRIDLEECNLITDSTLNHVAAFCPLMEQLTMSHCDQITDQGVHKLAVQLRRLVCIEIDNCPFISDTSLEYLANHFPALRRVELYDCQLITQDAIGKFQQRRPEVRLHTYFAPATPQQTDPPGAGRQRYCRCCVIV